MGVLRDRLVVAGGQASLRSTETPVAEVFARLLAGEIPSKLVAAGTLSAADVVAALAQSALGDDDAEGPSLTQARPRYSRLADALAEPAWVAVLPGAAHRARLTLAAGLLQIFDFWDASHDAAQQADNVGVREFSAYWHGIAHRREPDAANAAYWFRRVANHPVHQALARAARPLLTEHGDDELAARLIRDGVWNSTAMIDLCTGLRQGTPREGLARRLQRLEMWLLLEATFAAFAPASPC
jgi:uncharacterized protein (DUF433 family)